MAPLRPRTETGIPKSGSLPSLALLARAAPALGSVAWPEPAFAHTPSFSAACTSHFAIDGEKLPAQRSLDSDLQHPGAAEPELPALNAGDSESELNPREYRELFLDVLHMGHVNLEYLGQRVGSLKARDGSKLRRAFRTRTAELLDGTSVAGLEDAARALAVLQAMDQGLPCSDFWAESDAWPKSSSADPTSWQSPSRALEERIGKLVLQHRCQVDVLVRCHEVVSDLVSNGLMRPRALEPVRSCLVMWVQKVPLLEVRRRAASVRKIVAAEPSLLVSLEQRILQRIKDSFSHGQLPGFAQVLLDLQAGGLPLLEGVGPREADPASGRRLPCLQLGLLAALRGGLSRWPMRRLAAEFQGPVLELMRSCEGALPELRAAASARVADGLRSAHAMVLRGVLPTKVQDELLDWGALLRSLLGAGLLSLGEPERLHILAGPRDPGSLASCCASITPGAPEFMPAYRGRAQELLPQAQDVSDLVATVHALLGRSGVEDRRRDSAPAAVPSRR